MDSDPSILNCEEGAVAVAEWHDQDDLEVKFKLLVDLIVQDWKYRPSAITTARFIGPALRVLRVARFLTQETVAELMSKKLNSKVRQTYVCRVEKGEIKVSWDRLEAMSEVLSCKPAVIVEIAGQLAVLDEKGPYGDELLSKIEFEVKSRLGD